MTFCHHREMLVFPDFNTKQNKPLPAPGSSSPIRSLQSDIFRIPSAILNRKIFTARAQALQRGQLA
jgi:hypothetical protein